jgi:hypothetical protein
LAALLLFQRRRSENQSQNQPTTMKKILAFTILFSAILINTQAQDIIKGVRNQAILVKGSRALPMVKFKDGQMVSITNTDEGMSFTMTKNGKITPLFDPVDAKFGQIAEVDVEGDGKMEIVTAYRLTDGDFTLNIFKKPDYEFEYKLWSTINGKAYAEFPQNGTVKLYTKEGNISVMKFDSEGLTSPAK